MQQQSINPLCLQSLFESASNAADKGQAQYFTPVEWGRVLTLPLPRYRPVIVDLHCGAGHLLQAAERPSTHDLLGCDIEPPDPNHAPDKHRLTADAFRLLPLMHSVHWCADLFVLNPPWDLHLHRKHLALLEQSDLPTLRAAFKARDPRLAKDQIDSTVATLALALDRCSIYGEGLLIANESTLQRLMLGPHAPHAALAAHVWAHLTITGNICAAGTSSQPSSDFATGVLYFARDHDIGFHALFPRIETLEQADATCRDLFRRRSELRRGADIRNYAQTESIHEKWDAIREEWERLNSQTKPLWNLSLNPDGTITANLSLFDQASERVSNEQAGYLFQLNGKHPMQLVMLRHQRNALERAAFATDSPWRVDPALKTAIRQAVADYHAVRAPLYPLSPIQRLGYLDEQDEITCTKDLGAFRADGSYKLRSTTVAVRRSGTKMNLMGEEDAVQWDGQELAFFITDAAGVERCFMEARLRGPNFRVSHLAPGEKPGRQREDDIKTCNIDFTLHELVDHFLIPDVPDVARVYPDRYQQNLNLLSEIEALSIS